MDIAAPPKGESSSSSPSKLGKVERPSGIKGLKPPTRVTGSAQKTPAKKAGASASAAQDLGPAVSHDEDPIASAMQARTKAGGPNSQLKELEAKK